jgi:hypothetical protein
MKSFIFFCLFLLSASSFSQNGIIRGRVFDEINNEAIIGATVVIQGSSAGAVTDIEGNYEIIGLTPGLYNLQVSYLGYETKTVFEVQVTNAAPAILNLAMKPSAQQLQELVIQANPFTRQAESPLSLTSIGVNEIQRSPGGNRDISRTIQLLPGVTTGLSFRNDLLVRGGGPNENRFYVDDIEVPTINHFTTQGASGGSNGLLNVDFIQKADFYTGAFPAARGNTLSSVLELTQAEGRSDRVGFTATIGASDAGITLQGPFNNKSHFLLSARRSYLQLLFKAFKLPFLPTYTDFQVKTTHKFNNKHDLTFVGLGALDNLKLNLDLGETEEQQFFLGNIPYFDQWNYTTGVRYRYFRERSYMIFVLSRSMLGNRIYKDIGNDNSDPANRVFDLDATEAENKLRFEHTARMNGYKISYGANYEFARYTNTTFNKVVTNEGTFDLLYDTKLKLQKYGFFAQVSRAYFQEKLSLSLGLRADGTNYNSLMSNPFRQISPRFSASYAITEGLSINFNTGWYHQLPSYTVLGFRDSLGMLVNKPGLEYINNAQVVGGLAYTTNFNTRFSAEGFYKRYYNYPMLTDKGISLANLGGDFGVVGDEPATSSSEGKTYGLEIAVQQKFFKGFYGLANYTFYRSMFTDTSGRFAPSSWDNRHVFNLVGGYKFKRNWEIGVKWKILGGKPYSPYNESLSAIKEVWDAKGVGIEDYTRLNSERTKAVHQMDMRIDKKWFFNRWNLNLYLDIVNLYNFAVEDRPNLTVVRNSEGQAVEDPEDATRYQLKYLENKIGNLIPSIGLVVAF